MSLKKVIAKAKGQYNGVMYYPGDAFYIDDSPLAIHEVTPHGGLAKDADGNPIVTGERSPLASWMEFVDESNELTSGEAENVG